METATDTHSAHPGRTGEQRGLLMVPHPGVTEEWGAGCPEVPAHSGLTPRSPEDHGLLKALRAQQGVGMGRTFPFSTIRPRPATSPLALNPEVGGLSARIECCGCWRAI